MFQDKGFLIQASYAIKAKTMALPPLELAAATEDRPQQPQGE
jgi:hypothetical protein